MAVSSSTTLTKYESAVTIVTAAVANTWFGGLFGSSEGDSYASTDPLVAGHTHDGAHQDGHAQKINLVSHVVGRLTNTNLANDSVTKRNVGSFINQGQAIPEYEIIDGTTYYHLDLTTVYDAMEPSFKTISFAASGGTLGGDGAGSIIADTLADTLLIKAGANITITTQLLGDSFTISSSASGNAFETHSFAANGGSASGGSVVADSVTDTLNWEAGSGIIITSTPGTDTVNISKTNAFGDISVSTGGRGISSGANIEADVALDTFDVQAEDGMDISTSPGSDRLIIKNRYAFSHGALEVNSWSGGWGTVAATNLVSGGENLSYNHITADQDYAYNTIPVPQSLQPERPGSIVFRAYFASKNNGVGYLEGLVGPTTFTVELQFGSNESQTGPVTIGTIGNGQDLMAAAQLLWGAQLAETSINVDAERKLYVLSWSIQDLELGNNELGLLPVRMRGTTNFQPTGDFDKDIARAEIQFLKADYTWHI